MAAQRLSVAMCTYNGAAFLPQQLQSLLLQSLPPDELVVCDDGSTDASGALLAEFARRAPFEVRVERNAGRLGVVGNFSRAIGLCTGEYIALCDQDDVWLPERLRRCMDAARAARQDVPLMVHSDLALIDETGRVFEASSNRRRGFRSRHSRPLAELVLQNYATGCTILFNRRLAERALPIPPGVSIHDWWLALLAAAEGSVISLPEALVQYRQHGGNALGPKGRDDFDPYWVTVGRTRWIFRRALTLDRAALTRLRERGGAGEAQRFIARFLDEVERGGLAAVRWLRDNGVAMQRPVPTAAFLAHVLLAPFRDAAQPRGSLP